MIQKLLPNTWNRGFSFELVLSFDGFDKEFSCPFRDDGILIDVFGENVIIIVSDVVGCDVDDGMSGSLGVNMTFDVCVVSSRGITIDRRWRH
jgi:hypothetical protein